MNITAAAFILNLKLDAGIIRTYSKLFLISYAVAMYVILIDKIGMMLPVNTE